MLFCVFFLNFLFRKKKGRDKTPIPKHEVSRVVIIRRVSKYQLFNAETFCGRFCVRVYESREEKGKGKGL